MARTSPETVLEVVPDPWAPAGSVPAGSPPTGDVARRRRGRRRVAAGALLLVVVAAVAAPVRSTVAVNELGHLARRWSWFQSLDGQRTMLNTQMTVQALDPTDPVVLEGGAALAGEEAALVVSARARLLAGWHLPDGGLSRLRLAMAGAFADEADDLATLTGSHTVPSPRDPQSTRATTATVDRLLTAQQARWHQKPVRPVVAPPLGAATSELARLALPSDQPIAARLLLIDGRTLGSVDLGAGRGRSSVPVVQGANLLTGPVVARAGYLAVGANSPFPDQANVYAVPPDLAGPPRVIGSTFLDVVVPAAEPDGVWLQSGAGAVEVNGAGAVLHDPVALGLGRILIGATDQVLVTSGLVTSEPTAELQVVPIGGADPRQASDLTTRGQLVAAGPGNLAWLDTIAGGAVVLKLADGAGHAVRIIAPDAAALTAAGVPPGTVPVDTGAFSPDGSLLVERYMISGTGPDNLRLGLVEVESGRVTLIGGAIGNHTAGAIVWSPAGDRVFFVEAVASQPWARIATWAVGSPSPSVVRLPTPGLINLAAVSD